MASVVVAYVVVVSVVVRVLANEEMPTHSQDKSAGLRQPSGWTGKFP